MCGNPRVCREQDRGTPLGGGTVCVQGGGVFPCVFLCEGEPQWESGATLER